MCAETYVKVSLPLLGLDVMVHCLVGSVIVPCVVVVIDLSAVIRISTNCVGSEISGTNREQ
jgi:hypothetical protein